MKKSKLLAAAAIALGTLQAHAVTTDWSSHDSIEFGDHKVLASGSFEDTFGFSLADTTTLSATAVSNNLGRAFNIDGGSVSLYEVAPGDDTLIGSFAFDGTTGSTAHTFNALASGDYYYQVSGNATGMAGGWYSLVSAAGAAVTPVPEPHVASLMLAGLGVLGLVARRRQPGRS
ncbi:MAG TPA: FxDxF family PEP-CTERM protein [Albitalea sp.]|nr:FxDxF family PEP-CTERM protein [Albitalea sp.]